MSQVVRRASGEGLQASRVEVLTDDEDVDTSVAYTITVTVRNYLGQVVVFLYRDKRYVIWRAINNSD